MKRTVLLGLGMIAICSLLVACGDDTTAAGGAGGGGGGGGTEPTGGAGEGGGITGPTVTYSGTLNEITAGGTVPLGDVELCAESHPAVACVTADAEGAYTWPGLPANAEVLIRATKADYLDSTTFLVTGDEDVTDYTGGMISRTTLGLLYSIIGIEYDATKASVALTVVTPELDVDGNPTGEMIGVAGATATMSPASGTGPVYSGDTGIPNVENVATSENGAALWAGVNPGDVTVDVVADGLTCTLGVYGWPTTDGVARGTLSADSASFFQAVCE